MLYRNTQQQHRFIDLEEYAPCTWTFNCTDVIISCLLPLKLLIVYALHEIWLTCQHQLWWNGQLYYVMLGCIKEFYCLVALYILLKVNHYRRHRLSIGTASWHRYLFIDALAYLPVWDTRWSMLEGYVMVGGYSSARSRTSPESKAFSRA